MRTRKKMKKQRNFFNKTLIIGIIFLFFGASISPSICGDFNKSNVKLEKQVATGGRIIYLAPYIN